MVLRMFNVDKWTTVEEKHSLVFANPKPRTVRLDVNAPQETELHYVCQATGETWFLALVKGRDSVEFSSVGPFELTVRGGYVNVFTNDGADVSMAPTNEASFVKVMQRARRNPELEHMMFLMEQNTRRREEQTAHELRALYDRVASFERAAATIERGTGAGGVVEPESTPAGNAGADPGGSTPDGEGEENDITDTEGA